MTTIHNDTKNVIKELQKTNKQDELNSKAQQAQLQKLVDGLKELTSGLKDTAADAAVGSAGSAGINLETKLNNALRELSLAAGAIGPLPELTASELGKVVSVLKAKLEHILPPKDYSEACAMLSGSDSKASLIQYTNKVNNDLGSPPPTQGSEGPFHFYMSASAICTDSLMKLITELDKLTQQLKDLSSQQAQMIGDTGSYQAKAQLKEGAAEKQKLKEGAQSSMVAGVVGAVICAVTVAVSAYAYVKSPGVAADEAQGTHSKLSDIRTTDSFNSVEDLQVEAPTEQEAEAQAEVKGRVDAVREEVNKLRDSDTSNHRLSDTLTEESMNSIRSSDRIEDADITVKIQNAAGENNTVTCTVRELFQDCSKEDSEAMLGKLERSSINEVNTLQRTNEKESKDVNNLLQGYQPIATGINSGASQLAQGISQEAQAEATYLSAAQKADATLYQTTNSIANSAVQRTEGSHASVWSSIGQVISKLGSIGMGMNSGQ